MLIVADENIPLLDAFFEGFGEIRRVPGRSIDRATVERGAARWARHADRARDLCGIDHRFVDRTLAPFRRFE